MPLPDQPPADAVEEAKRHPNGWVYQIVGDFGPNDAVPPEAIAGAWKVDGAGHIVGRFIPNPRFKDRRPWASAARPGTHGLLV
jgi:hypothetical protein